MILRQVIHYPDTNSVEATWVDADGVQIKCHSYADVQMDMFRTDVLALGGNIAEHEAMIAVVEAAIVPYVAPPPVIPSIVSMRRARLALLGAGLLDSVNAAVAAMTGPAGDAARIEWEYAAEVDRGSALVGGLAQVLALTPPRNWMTCSPRRPRSNPPPPPHRPPSWRFFFDHKKADTQ